MQMRLLLFALLALPSLAFAQSGTTQEFGNMSYFDFNGVTGTSQQMGNMEFYNFSNGTTATRQRFGSIDYYSSPSPSLNGNAQTFGNMSYGTWNDGTRSTSQRFGTMQYNTFQRGNQTLTCSSQQIGQQTYTTCR